MTKAQAGPKPLSDAIRKRLIKRGYTILENAADVTDQQASILLRHKKPLPNAFTWAATRTGFKKAYIKGPRDRPYIPASWRLHSGAYGGKGSE